MAEGSLVKLCYYYVILVVTDKCVCMVCGRFGGEPYDTNANISVQYDKTVVL